MRRSRLEIVKFEVMTYFDGLPKRVYTPSEMSAVMELKREEWRLPSRLSLARFVEFLEQQGALTTHEFRFSRAILTRFFWRTPTALEIALSFKPNAYLSHYSAMHYHGLVSEKNPPVVYVNDEQTPKPRSKGVLIQSGIDTAFSRPARVTSNVQKWGGVSFYLLNGKHTGNLGVVVERALEIPTPVRVASLERTLVDVVVKPGYSAGVGAVLEAYRRAAPRVSVAEMLKILQGLDYVYPYHQAIGFCLSYVGCYKREDVELFSNLSRDYDFYLVNQMRDMKYSDEWRLYYPSNL